MNRFHITVKVPVSEIVYGTGVKSKILKAVDKRYCCFKYMDEFSDELDIIKNIESFSSVTLKYQFINQYYLFDEESTCSALGVISSIYNFFVYEVIINDSKQFNNFKIKHGKQYLRFQESITDMSEHEHCCFVDIQVDDHYDFKYIKNNTIQVVL